MVCLNDFTVSRDVFERAKGESVTTLSLLRDIPEEKYEEHINAFYQLLRPPINLGTMRRIFGSTGWDDVDKGLVEMQRLLSNANIHFYYNAIATIGREILIGIADRIYNDDVHRDKDEHPNPPKDNQFINKLHGFVEHTYLNKEMTKNMKDFIKSTIVLVQGYVHKNEVEQYECVMCVHAVISLVFQLSIICNLNKYVEANR